MVPATFLPLYLTLTCADAELADVLVAAVGGDDVGQGAQGDDIVERSAFCAPASRWWGARR